MIEEIEEHIRHHDHDCTTHPAWPSFCAKLAGTHGHDTHTLYIMWKFWRDSWNACLEKERTARADAAGSTRPYVQPTDEERKACEEYESGRSAAWRERQIGYATREALFGTAYAPPYR